MHIDEIRLKIPGTPKGKGRPRFWKGHAVTPPETRAAERAIVQAWVNAGSPRLPDNVPLYLNLYLCVERPLHHYLPGDPGVRGLSAEGQRHAQPEYKKPDVDNAAKLVMDALSGHAYGDDVQICDLHVYRFWGDPARTEIEIGLA